MRIYKCDICGETGEDGFVSYSEDMTYEDRVIFETLRLEIDKEIQVCKACYPKIYEEWDTLIKKFFKKFHKIKKDN